MKKIFFTTLLLLSIVNGYTQTSLVLANNYNVPSGNQKFSVQYLANNAWSLSMVLKNPHGTLNGTVIIDQSIDNINWYQYSSNSYFILQPDTTIVNGVSTLNKLISGSDTLYSFNYSDNTFAGNYMRIRFYKGSMTSGKFSATLNFKKP